VFAGRYKVNCIQGPKSVNIKTQCSFGDRGVMDKKCFHLFLIFKDRRVYHGIGFNVFKVTIGVV